MASLKFRYEGVFNCLVVKDEWTKCGHIWNSDSRCLPQYSYEFSLKSNEKQPFQSHFIFFFSFQKQSSSNDFIFLHPACNFRVRGALRTVVNSKSSVSVQALKKRSRWCGTRPWTLPKAINVPDHDQDAGEGGKNWSEDVCFAWKREEVKMLSKVCVWSDFNKKLHEYWGKHC